MSRDRRRRAARRRTARRVIARVRTRRDLGGVDAPRRTGARPLTASTFSPLSFNNSSESASRPASVHARRLHLDPRHGRLISPLRTLPAPRRPRPTARPPEQISNPRRRHNRLHINTRRTVLAGIFLDSKLANGDNVVLFLPRDAMLARY